MMKSGDFRRIPALLFLLMIYGCAGNIGAAAPFVLALSNCSTPVDADRMIPESALLLSREWTYRIREVCVEGPEKGIISPPIPAETFQKSLDKALRRAGVIEPDPQMHNRGSVLEALIVSEIRSVTFTRTTLELTVHYVLKSAVDEDESLWENVVTTTGQIDDWKTDACERVRNLQEKLSQDNIQQLIGSLPAKR